MDDSTVLDPPGAGSEADSFELRRPEIKGLMDRYCTYSHHAQVTTIGPPTALIVTRHPGEDAALRETLENEAWRVEACSGPGGGGCPLMQGASCDLRESADAAIVFVDANEFSGSLGTIPRLRCAADSSSPGVVVLEGSREPARFMGSSATVGALTGTKAILATVKSLLDARAHPPENP